MSSSSDEYSSSSSYSSCGIGNHPTSSGSSDTRLTEADDPCVPVCQYVIAFDNLLNDYLRPFVEVSCVYGGHVKAAALMLQKVFVIQSKLLARVATMDVPSDREKAVLFRPLVTSTKMVQQLRAVKPHSRWASHLSAVAETSRGLLWMQEDAPGNRMYLARKSIEFFLKYVKRNFKEPRTKKYVRALNSLMKHLHKYVNAYHTHGLDWGGRACSSQPDQADAAQAAADPEGDFYDDVIVPAKGVTSTATTPASASDAHTPYVPIRATDTPALGALNASLNVSSIMLFGKAPVAERDGVEWRVENHHNQRDLEIVDAEANHLVIIRNCHSVTLHVIAPSIAYVLIEDCNKVQVVVSSVEDGVEIINSRSVVVTAAGQVPFFDVEKSSGIVCTLSAACVEASDIYTASCADVRVAYIDNPEPGTVQGAPEGEHLVEKVIAHRFISSLDPETGLLETKAIFPLPDKRTRQGVNVVRKLLMMDSGSQLDDVE